MTDIDQNGQKMAKQIKNDEVRPNVTETDLEKLQTPTKSKKFKNVAMRLKTTK